MTGGKPEMAPIDLNALIFWLRQLHGTSLSTDEQRDLARVVMADAADRLQGMYVAYRQAMMLMKEACE